MTPLEVLKASSFGRRTAEEEHDHLQQYFVETEQWTKVFAGEVDIVYGPKGSGKSAIYSLIIKNEEHLFDRGVLIVPGENPQGAPAFQHLRDDTPENEFEFVSLWKLYVLTLCGQSIKGYGFKSKKAQRVVRELEDAGLLPAHFTLSKIVRYVLEYVRKNSNVEAVENSMQFDPVTGTPIGVANKIYLREPSSIQSKLGAISVDELYQVANDALKEEGVEIWIVLDRLDVAFTDKPSLEDEALKALFKFYLDTKGSSQIRPKIFLRTDIWQSITKQGFREASHIERSKTITWKEADLTNLVVRRLLSNQAICDYYTADKAAILSDFKKQTEFIYRVFPDQVDSGGNKPSTMTWILSRTADGTKESAPREVIHLLNELREEQISRLERGEKPPQGERLFEQVTFKEALPAVSKARLEQTIFAEFPDERTFVEALTEQKATHTTATLAKLWSVEEIDASKIIGRLLEIGVLEKQGAFWRVPFLYRPALASVQGSADDV